MDNLIVILFVVLLIIIILVCIYKTTIFGGLPFLNEYGEKLQELDDKYEVTYINVCLYDEAINKDVKVKVTDPYVYDIIFGNNIYEIYENFPIKLDELPTKKFYTLAIFNENNVGKCYVDYNKNNDNERINEHKILLSMYKIANISINIDIDDEFQGKDICRHLFSENVKFLLNNINLDIIYNENVSENMSSIKCYDSAMNNINFTHVIVYSNLKSDDELKQIIKYQPNYKENLFKQYQSFYIKNLDIINSNNLLIKEKITCSCSQDMIDKLNTKKGFKYFIYPTTLFQNEKLINDKYISKSLDNSFEVIIIY